MSFWQILAWPFGKILYLCYLLVRNYGWALFLFTAIVKLIMFPSSYNQQISTEKMNRLNPKLEALKKKYAGNQDKLNEATMELYNQENVSPMGSCLPTLITFILLFAIIEVVYAPLSYIGNVDSSSLDAAEEMVVDIYDVSSVISDHETTVSEILAENTNLYDILLEYKAEEDSGLADYSDERLEELAGYFELYNDAYDNNGDMIGLDEYFLDSNLVSSRLVASSNRTQLLVISVAKVYPELFEDDVVDLCADFDYTFLGIDLGDYPSWTSILVLIPIMSLALQLILTFISQYFTKKKGGAATSGSMKIMLYAMPLLSFWIAFSFPAGIGIYWIFSSLFSLVQTVFLNLYLTPARIDRIIAKDNEKAKKKRKKKSFYQQALEAQQAENAGKARLSKYDDDEEDDDDASEEVKLSRAQKKEVERNTLNEARRRYAEKYGDNVDVDVPEMEDTKKK